MTDQLTPPPLIAYLHAKTRTERSIAFLRLYAEKVRNGYELTWEIPSVRADTLNDIANYCEELAAALLQAQTRTQELEHERDELSVTIKRLYRDVPLLLDQLTAARAEIARLEAPPGPRCDQCRHWEPNGPHDGMGICHWIETSDYGPVSPSAKAFVDAESPGVSALYTASDFGCVQFEAKPLDGEP